MWYNNMKATILKNIFKELGYSNITNKFIELPNIMRINLTNNNNIYPYVNEYFHLDTAHSLLLKARNVSGKYERKVPTEYKEVQYIESTGTQWIDTEIYGYANDVIEIRGNYVNISTQDNILGCHNSGRYRRIRLLESEGVMYYGGSAGVWNENTVLEGFGHAGTPLFNIGPADTNTHTFIFDHKHNSLSVDGVTDYFQGGLDYADREAPGVNTERHNTMALFGYKHDSAADVGAKAKFKLEYVKITQNGVVKREFIPVVRTSDNKPGLYDLVTKEFFTNKATSGKDFKVGPDEELEPDTVYEIVDVAEIVSIETRNTISASEFAGHL